ncbi:MAG: tryptophan synthase subunit alpha [Firmicutes bacterium]|nr:tryptophan synthase subunit alpha [Bacillota bacterium]
MNRIDSRFVQLRSEGRKALICYLTAGFPDLDSTGELVLELCRQGADIIELGVPFSDPLADGPIIQKASQRALDLGTTPRAVLKLVTELRKCTDAPITLLTYYNPIHQYGLANFVDDCASCGVDGLIVPDLPLEESSPLRELAEARRIWLIGLVAPTSTPDRVAKLCAVTKGFLYCISVTGVTGLRADLWEGLRGFLEEVRRTARVPVAIGFGISTPDQARRAASYSDGVIVGSAIMQRIEECPRPAECVPVVGQLAGELRQALDMDDESRGERSRRNAILF